MKKLSQKGGISKSIKDREKPSSKQLGAILVLQEKVEKGGRINYGAILTEAGYSPNTAKTPQKVFGKPIVKKELAQRGLNPESLKRTHEDLLNAFKLDRVIFPIEVPVEDIKYLYENIISGYFICAKRYPERGITQYDFLVPDKTIRSAALEIGYKIFPPKTATESNIKEKTHTKHLELIQEMKNNLKERKKLLFP